MTQAGPRTALRARSLLESSRRIIEFDMKTGTQRDDRTSNGDYVSTPQQLKLDNRRKDALAALQAHGIEFSPGRDRPHHRADRAARCGHQDMESGRLTTSEGLR